VQLYRDGSGLGAAQCQAIVVPERLYTRHRCAKNVRVFRGLFS
jgi:hypothetical protein